MPAIFLIDINLPVVIVASMLYILPITFVLRMDRLNYIYLVSAAATVLTAVAAPIKASGEVLPLLFNRPIFIAIIWIITYLGVQRRIHEKKQEELLQKVNRTTQELQRSNEELKDFAYVASHDLREPLRIVSGYMALLERKYSSLLDDTGREWINFAKDGAIRMDALIIDLLTYSRAGTTTLTPVEVDLGRLTKGVLHDLDKTIAEAEAHVEVGPLPTIVADATQMAQLFQNLIGNAIKYRGERPPEVRITSMERSDEWEISIRDNGIGIPPEQQGRLFRMFSRLHTRYEYEGTGIGLATAKRIVERHGGRIWVESDGNNGSTFRFTLAKGSIPVVDQDSS